MVVDEFVVLLPILIDLAVTTDIREGYQP